MKRLIAFSFILFALAGCAQLKAFHEWGMGRDTAPPYVDEYAWADNLTAEQLAQLINWEYQRQIVNEMQWTNQILMTPNVWR